MKNVKNEEAISGPVETRSRLCHGDIRGTEETRILGGNKLEGKTGSSESYMDFHISKVARPLVSYPYAVYA